ncbi:unnamed protein product, partial [Candidula unifasciata]
IYILACLIDFFTTRKIYTQTTKGFKVGDVTMTFESIYNDVCVTMDSVHSSNGPLKEETMNNVEKYVEKDDHLPVLLTRLRTQGKKVFLATNSDYKYTNKIMNYLFDAETNPDNASWITFFDFIVVDARKPLFFAQGTVLREVNIKTGGLHLGTFTGKIRSNAIYSGGSVDVFNGMMGMVNSSAEVLYVGDHIFGDILKSKKNRGWRTFLVVPEMLQELAVWTQQSQLFRKLSDYDAQIADMYRNMDSSDVTHPNITKIKKAIREATHEMDMAYGKLGSVFRSGSRQTFFATQVMRYADLYAATFTNLIHYPLTYCFRSPPMHMPHESTVDHDATITDEKFRSILATWKSKVTGFNDSQSRQSLMQRSDSTTQRLFCEAPQELVEVADDFLEDDPLEDDIY